MSLDLAVVVKPFEPTGHKCHLLIVEALHLILYDGQQIIQSKQSRCTVRGRATSRDQGHGGHTRVLDLGLGLVVNLGGLELVE
jgi:hypothetical protein